MFTGPWLCTTCLTFWCFYCRWPGCLLTEVGQDVALGSCAFKRSVTHRRWEKVHPANESHVGVSRTFYAWRCSSHSLSASESLSFIYSFFQVSWPPPLSLCLSHAPLKRRTYIQQLNTHTSSSTLEVSWRWVSYPQVLYYLDAEHYEPFSVHENRDICPLKLDTMRIWTLNVSMYYGKTH